VALADLSCADAYTFQHSIDGRPPSGCLSGSGSSMITAGPTTRASPGFTRIDERLTQLGLGLLLHDIGKLAIPTAVLNKPGKLTPEEWAMMESHPRLGVDLLGGSAWSPLIKSIVLRHHERWNGSGYPDGKARRGDPRDGPDRGRRRRL